MRLPFTAAKSCDSSTSMPSMTGKGAAWVETGGLAAVICGATNSGRLGAAPAGWAAGGWLALQPKSPSARTNHIRVCWGRGGRFRPDIARYFGGPVGSVER